MSNEGLKWMNDDAHILEFDAATKGRPIGDGPGQNQRSAGRHPNNSGIAIIHFQYVFVAVA